SQTVRRSHNRITHSRMLSQHNTSRILHYVHRKCNRFHAHWISDTLSKQCHRILHTIKRAMHAGLRILRRNIHRHGHSQRNRTHLRTIRWRHVQHRSLHQLHPDLSETIHHPSHRHNSSNHHLRNSDRRPASHHRHLRPDHGLHRHQRNPSSDQHERPQRSQHRSRSG